MIRPGPLYGLVRARNYALDFLFRYFVSGLAWAMVPGLISLPEAAQISIVLVLVCAHVFSVIVVLPAAIMANFLALRILRSRSWRREPWRAWVAGILGPPLVWGGTTAWLMLQPGTPEVVVRAGDWGALAYVFGIVILFSNLAVLIGWLLPVRRSRTGGRQ